MSIFRQSARKENLYLRAKVIQAIRRFFNANDYLEVETPVRIPAPAPESHIDAQPSEDWFLQTSPELCMKSLLAAGYPRVFQICRCFRRNERGRRHLPEMTLLEWYRSKSDYRALMDECEALIGFVAHSLEKNDGIVYRNHHVDLDGPWDRLTVRSAFERFATLSVDEALDTDRFDEIMGIEIEPHLGREHPLFLYDYPACKGALARLKPDDSSVAERFELYIQGIELCNAFSELNDAAEQRKRFEAEQVYRAETGKRVYPMPEKFLQALKRMPESAGIALGVDRLVMLFADVPRIDDVVAFTPEEL